MKNVSIAGRLGKDSELRRTQSGDPVLSFSVAVDDGFGQQKTTIWFDCSVWGKRGEALSQHLKKGTAVAVSGDLSTRVHNDKTYLTVNVSQVTMQGGGERQSAPASKGREQSSYSDDSDTRTRELDDEIPF